MWKLIAVNILLPILKDVAFMIFNSWKIRQLRERQELEGKK